MLADVIKKYSEQVECEAERTTEREKQIFLQLIEKDHNEICRTLAHILVRLENIETKTYRSDSKHAIY